MKCKGEVRAGLDTHDQGPIDPSTLILWRMTDLMQGHPPSPGPSAWAAFAVGGKDGVFEGRRSVGVSGSR